MLVHESYEDVAVPGLSTAMRTHIFRPRSTVGLEDASVKLGGVVVFSEIYQITGPIERVCRLIASEGFLVAAPEIFHEFEEAGAALPFTAEGTQRGCLYKDEKKDVREFDRDIAAVVGFVSRHRLCNGRVGAVGLCVGGHLAFRAAMRPEVRAAVCFFATDIHSSSLGGSGDDTLARLAELRGSELAMIWGRQDDHVPRQGRTKLKDALDDAEVCYSWSEFNAGHAFIRDESSKGRYDASLSSICHALMLELLRRRITLGLPSQSQQSQQADNIRPAEATQ